MRFEEKIKKKQYDNARREECVLIYPEKYKGRITFEFNESIENY